MDMAQSLGKQVAHLNLLLLSCPADCDDFLGRFAERSKHFVVHEENHVPGVRESLED